MKMFGKRDVARGGTLSRILAALGIMAMLLLLVAVAAGCGGSDETTTTAGGTETTAAGGVPRGGVLKVGMQPGNGQYDPVLMAGSVGDILLNVQVQENLVDLAQDFSVFPVLATEWDSEDGKTWKFTLREGATFHNGEPFTADDVVYSFDRLRSEELGSPMAGVYSNIESVVADDPTHVTFNLTLPDSEFVASLTDYRAKMLSKSVADPMTELIGTGPFMLESFAAEDRAVLKAFSEYWGTDEAGDKLPYLEGVEFIYSPDTAGQVEGLQGGSLNWVGGLSAAQKETVEANPSLKTISTATNYCNELQIRVDVEPGSKLEFRQALMAGTDRQALIDLVAPGVGDPGNGTLVGPAYADYYLDEEIPYDPAKAKELLAAAGYPDGVAIRLVAQTADPIPGLATAWQAQMKAIGVEVEIQQVPTDVYYAEEGQDNWYQAPFGIVDWGTRASPITYFKLAMTSTAAWNYSRWSNAEFDAIVEKIPQTLDDAERAELYKDAQRILQTEVPMINFIVLLGVAGESANVDGIELSPDWAHTLFRTAHFTE
ncbi:MAG: ABC transporter substrate-binding protein [Actinobacteria bacterium]|nr:ABC transporter substrate-binding protein [Actinomycetota bacterium]